MPNQVTCACPACQRNIAIPADRTPGKRLRCPHCQQIFPWSAEEAATRTLAPISTAASFATAVPNANQATLTLDPHRSAQAKSSDAAPMPKKIGRFEIRRTLGEGGFGIVYEAHDPQLDRAIALKVAKLGGDSEQRIKRFLREAKSAANLRHPHIVPLYEFGQDGDQFYLALAYIPGQSLDHVLRALNDKKEKMDCRQAATLVRHLAEALAYAHGLGIVHRDVKPHNVMLDERGDPLLMDFGLAAREMDEKLTREGAVMGTPAYLAPEQFHGDPTAASDQYSLGVTLYELLTDETPFAGPPDVQIYNHLNTEPESPRKRNGAVSRDLETICLKCLEKDAAKRYADCRALADELRRWLDGEPILARPIGVIESAVKWAKRKPTLAAAMALAVLTVLLGGLSLVAGWGWRSAETARNAEEGQKLLAQQAQKAEATQRRAAEIAQQNTETQKRLAESAKLLAEEEEKKARKAEIEEAKQRAEANKQRERAEGLVYISEVKNAHHSWLMNDVPTANSLLDACRLDRRGWEYDYVRRLCLGSRVTFKIGSLKAISFSSDGRRVISVVGAGAGVKVHVRDAQTGVDVFAENIPFVVDDVCISTDGKLIGLACRDGTLRAINSENGKELFSLGEPSPVTQLQADPFVGLWFTSDGKQLVISRMASTGVLKGNDGAIRIKGWNFETKVWSIETRKELSYHNKAIPFAYLKSARLSPDGRFLGSAGNESLPDPTDYYPPDDVKLWDVKTGEVALSFKGHPAATDSVTINSIRFNRSGDRIATASNDKTIKVWDAKTGTEIRSLTGHLNKVNCADFSPDGTRIVSCGDDMLIKVWLANTGEEKLCLRGHDSAVNNVCFSPDGKQILSTTKDGTVKVWDASEGQGFVTLSARASKPPYVKFGHDATPVNVWVNSDGLQGGRPVSICSEVAVASFGREYDACVAKAVKAHPGRFGTMASPNRKQIASTGSDLLVNVWDVPTAKIKFTLPGRYARFSPDGKWIATSGVGKTAKIWDSQTGLEMVTLTGLSDPGFSPSPSFNHDGNRIAIISGEEHLVKVYDWKKRQLIISTPGPLFGFSPDGSGLITASGYDNVVRLWDANSGKELAKLRGHVGRVRTVIYSPDGKRIASAGLDDRTIKLWDAMTGQEVFSLKPDHRGITYVTRDASGIDGLNEGGITYVGFTPDGKSIISIEKANTNPNRPELFTIKVWDTSPARAWEPPLVKTEEIRKFAGHAGLVHNVAVSTDGKTAVSVGSDRTGIVWDVESGELRHRLIGSPDQLYAVALTPDGKVAMTGGQDIVSPKGKSDFKVRAWDTLSGKQIQALAGHTGIVSRLATMQKGERFVSSAWDHAVRRWNAIDGSKSELLFRFDHPISALAIEPASEQIALGTPHGSISFPREGEAKANWIAALPFGVENLAWVSASTIAAAGVGKVPALVDIATKHRITLVGHTENAQAIDAIPGGKYVVTGSDDGTVRVWNVSDGSELSRFNPGCGMIRALRVLPDGQRVLCTGSDGTLRLWRLPLPKT